MVVTNRPTLYIVAGPNGAGKTTFSTEFLPEFVNCLEFLNADLIAAGLSPFLPESQDYLAARLMLTRMNELVEAGHSFGVESTLAGRGYVRRLKQLRSKGYAIALFYLWLPSPEIAITRVMGRFRQGGHMVPEEVVRRRYAAGLHNVFTRYIQLTDVWRFYDASLLPPRLVAQSQQGEHTILDEPLFRTICNAAGQ